MRFTTILPALSALLSMTQPASAAAATCQMTEDPKFVITGWSGTVKDNKQSFSFIMSTTFNTYRTGCSGSRTMGSSTWGWCNILTPGYNATFALDDAGLTFTHNYRCTSPTSKADTAAVATGAGTVVLSRTDMPDGTIVEHLDGESQTIPAESTAPQKRSMRFQQGGRLA